MKQLFLLEDDMSLISGHSFAVKKQGYEIDVARTTLEADTLWENGKYDLKYSYILQDDSEEEHYNADTVVTLKDFPKISMTLAEMFENVE